MSSMAERLREDAQRHCRDQHSFPQYNPFGDSSSLMGHQQQQQQQNPPQPPSFASSSSSHQSYHQPMMQSQQMPPQAMQQMPQNTMQPPPIFSQQNHPQAAMGTSSNEDIRLASAPVDVSQVRNDWRKHGVNLSQALEDVRNSRNPCHLRVKVVSAVERQDAVEQTYTAYVIHLVHQNVYIERRYSDFLKFKESSEIQVSVPFPSKATVFYKRKEAIVADRVKQLDAWLVHAVVEYNHGRIRDVMGFLNPHPLPHPFQRYDPDTDVLSLQSVVEILQRTVIPVDLWRTSFGLFVYTSFVPSLRGILLARRPQNSWAAPIAIQTIGVCRSSVVVITKESLIRDVCHGTRLDLGATQDALVAIGGSTEQIASVVTSVRVNVNAKYYGKQVPALELLQTDGPTHIPAARMVYEALNQMQLSG